MGKRVTVELLTYDEAVAAMAPYADHINPGPWVRIGDDCFVSIADDGIDGPWGRYDLLGRSIIEELTEREVAE